MKNVHPYRFDILNLSIGTRKKQEVEITAEINFKKRSLKGMVGEVILSTDRDGDVGIELKEDINAGSLDGVGKGGHCIYIEASLVKISE